jgi:general secretion pathway protein C
MLNPIVRTASRPRSWGLVLASLGVLAIGAFATVPHLAHHRRKAPAPQLSVCQDVTPSPRTGADEAPTAAELNAWIHTFDDTHHLVSHRLLDRMLEYPMLFAKSARLVPAVYDGQPVGLKLYAIVPGSIADRIGFKNGDTLRTINGFDLMTADKALEAYTRLRDASSLELTVTRHGQPVDLTIAIEPRCP